MLSSYEVVGGSCGKILVRTAYCDEVVKTCRAWGGRYEGGAWVISASRLEEVRRKLGENLEDRVEVEVGKDDWSGHAQIRVGWYVLAARRGRDDRATIYAELVAGTIPGSGGSMKHPAVSPSDDARFRLTVPRDFAEANDLEIVGDRVDRDALAAEREKLVARVAEIDAILTPVGAK